MKHKKSIRCPYCGGTAILRDASFVYGEKSYGGKVYVCSNYPKCDAYVGVHPGTRIPKGTLADQELRKKRMLAHQIFDQIWLRGILSRPDAYHWMADKFCLSDEQAHKQADERGQEAQMQQEELSEGKPEGDRDAGR